VNRELAALHGLSTFEVGNAVRGAIQGIDAAKYRTGNDEYDIVVRLAEPYRDQLSSLEDLVVYADGTPVPLVSVASWSVEEGLGSIHRKDMDRLATISADVRAGFNQNQVLAEVQQTLDEFAAQELPPGYQLRYTGQLEDQVEAQEFLTRAFVIALMLIAFILISQFNSIVKPLIILTSVIMSTVGVLVGLIVFDLPFVVVMTGIGIISLAGIVVNNAIVLIDYIDVLQERDGMNRREALVLGGITRFRPVMLTALTTALGLVPLAIGLNFDFFGLFASLSPDFYWGGEQAAWWRNMAITVIVGIVLATFLTLVLVPVMYALVDDLAAFFRRRFVGEPETPSPEPGAESGKAAPAGESAGAGGGENAPEAPERPESRPHPSREPALRRGRTAPGDLLPDAG
jgi:multidrug efflux pump